MRILSVLILVGMAGCAVSPTFEELETQALLSGDWSAVEKRERLLARRQARQGPNCPAGYVAYCVDRFYDNECTCLRREAMSIALSFR
jgi:hypothetical protein